MLSVCGNFAFYTSFLLRHDKTRLSIFQESLVFLSLCRCAKQICLPHTSYLEPVFSQESMLLYAIFFALYEKAIRSIHPLCSPRSTPTWPFDVKPPTYEPIGLIPTCEPSVLFEIILHQALKQTGPPCIENSCEFPISGNCGQPREYFLVAP